MLKHVLRKISVLFIILIDFIILIHFSYLLSRYFFIFQIYVNYILMYVN